MSSDLEKLAAAVRQLGDGSHPAHRTLVVANLFAKEVAAGVPDGRGAAAVVASLQQAATAAARAADELHSFAGAARGLADHLVRAGGGATGTQQAATPGRNPLETLVYLAPFVGRAILPNEENESFYIKLGAGMVDLVLDHTLGPDGSSELIKTLAEGLEPLAEGIAEFVHGHGPEVAHAQLTELLDRLQHPPGRK